jgi:hypothetical protein
MRYQQYRCTQPRLYLQGSKSEFNYISNPGIFVSTSSYFWTYSLSRYIAVESSHILGSVVSSWSLQANSFRRSLSSSPVHRRLLNRSPATSRWVKLSMHSRSASLELLDVGDMGIGDMAIGSLTRSMYSDCFRLASIDFFEATDVGACDSELFNPSSKRPCKYSRLKLGVFIRVCGEVNDDLDLKDCSSLSSLLLIDSGSCSIVAGAVTQPYILPKTRTISLRTTTCTTRGMLTARNAWGPSVYSVDIKQAGTSSPQ